MSYYNHSRYLTLRTGGHDGLVIDAPYAVGVKDGPTLVIGRLLTNTPQGLVLEHPRVFDKTFIRDLVKQSKIDYPAPCFPWAMLSWTCIEVVVPWLRELPVEISLWKEEEKGDQE